MLCNHARFDSRAKSLFLTVSAATARSAGHSSVPSARRTRSAIGRAASGRGRASRPWQATIVSLAPAPSRYARHNPFARSAGGHQDPGAVDGVDRISPVHRERRPADTLEVLVSVEARAPGPEPPRRVLIEVELEVALHRRARVPRLRGDPERTDGAEIDFDVERRVVGLQSDKRTGPHGHRYAPRTARRAWFHGQDEDQGGTRAESVKALRVVWREPIRGDSKLDHRTGHDGWRPRPASKRG